MRGNCEALETAQGGTGGREQDWDGNPDLQLRNPGSWTLNTYHPFGSLFQPSEMGEVGVIRSVLQMSGKRNNVY